ncbi:PIG-L deacetylase family protein [Methyloglobulus morosus]|nr:PIG-L deacetylase family protein [Methyloglobulus morosus]
MFTLKLNPQPNQPLSILCLGAHSDDIEIGCGGTVLKLLSENENVDVNWVVFGANGIRIDEANSSANLFLEGCKKRNIVVQNFKDGFFPYLGGEIKLYFEQLKKEVSPDIIFTHYRHDLHQDHRTISDLTWNTFRNHLILEYEIVKYDGDLGNPNFFVTLSYQVCQNKIKNIIDSFKSQASHQWFSEDAFLSLLRLRAIECNASEKYAEGFYSRKITF